MNLTCSILHADEQMTHTLEKYVEQTVKVRCIVLFIGILIQVFILSKQLLFSVLPTSSYCKGDTFLLQRGVLCNRLPLLAYSIL